MSRLQKLIKKVYRRIAWPFMIRIFPHSLIWNFGVSEEMDHWRDYFEWPKYASDLAFRLNPISELQPEIKQIFSDNMLQKIRILDVGSGPLTRIGKKWGDVQIEIVPIDPLAALYDELLQNYYITPLIKTIALRAEDIKLGENQFLLNFDLAYAHNSLDHCYDPIKAIINMFDVVKKGGWIYLDHRENEQIRTRSRGFHQWDFNIQEGKFYIRDNRKSHNVSALFEHNAKIYCYKKIEDRTQEGGMSEDPRIIVLIRKN